MFCVLKNNNNHRFNQRSPAALKRASMGIKGFSSPSVNPAHRAVRAGRNPRCSSPVTSNPSPLSRCCGWAAITFGEQKQACTGTNAASSEWARFVFIRPVRCGQTKHGVCMCVCVRARVRVCVSVCGALAPAVALSASPAAGGTTSSGGSHIQTAAYAKRRSHRVKP